MAIIIKKKARKFLDSGRPGAAFYATGLGRLGTTEPCFAMTIGEYRVILTVDQAKGMVCCMFEASCSLET